MLLVILLCQGLGSTWRFRRDLLLVILLCQFRVWVPHGGSDEICCSLFSCVSLGSGFHVEVQTRYAARYSPVSVQGLGSTWRFRRDLLLVILLCQFRVWVPRGGSDEICCSLFSCVSLGSGFHVEVQTRFAARYSPVSV